MSGSAPQQERAQEGHFRQRTGQEPSSQCWKELTRASNEEPRIIWASFPSCQPLLSMFTDSSLLKTYNPKPSSGIPALRYPAQITLPNTERTFATLLSSVCPFRGAAFLPRGFSPPAGCHPRDSPRVPRTGGVQRFLGKLLICRTSINHL